MATIAPPRPEQTIEPDAQKLEEFMHKIVGDMAAAMSGSLVITGTKLGLYKGLADIGPATSAELATHLGLDERYVREWLSAQAASGFVDYDSQGERFSLNAEQRMALSNEDSPVFVAPAFELIASTYIDEPKITDAFRSGAGVGWHEHHECLFRGCEKFFRPGYRANLVAGWIPALDGVLDKLQAGAKVADIGCGHGASTIIMAEAFPKQRLLRLRLSRQVDRSRPRRSQGSWRYPEREVRNVLGEGSAGPRLRLVCCFDCLHDMGDPSAPHGTSTRC